MHSIPILYSKVIVFTDDNDSNDKQTKKIKKRLFSDSGIWKLKAFFEVARV